MAFIGVHSPKFPNERDELMVREALRRHGIGHPVVVDAGHRIWSEYAVRAWPTLVVIDPFGNVLGEAPGEPDFDTFARLLDTLLDDYRKRGFELASDPLPVRPESAAPGALSYPTKLVAAGDRLYVADTGHHQIVELALRSEGSAEELRRFGTGRQDMDDGFEPAFDHPIGLALDPGGELLWIADSGNHAIRRLHLPTGQVRTVAGTGDKGGLPLPTGGDPLHAALRSPWDLAWDAARQRLLIAMAGSHQLFTFDPDGGRLELLAGAGPEARIDGALDEACFAQPSGLALIGDRLYVADSEISAIREVDFAAGSVRTVAGGDLFEFGDDDGRGDRVRLQHPMGIAADDGRLFLADSYNHKVKTLDPATGEVTTRFGNGEPFFARLLPDAAVLPESFVAGADGPLFFEPEGLTVHEGVLYVADSNNHRIIAIRLADGTARIVAGE